MLVMSLTVPKLRAIPLSMCLVLIALVSLFFVTSNAQEKPEQYAGKTDAGTARRRGLLILRDVQQILDQKYYDRRVRGMDVKKRFKEAEEQIKQHEKNWQIYRTIAQILIELNDSHTNFLPPDRLYRVEYGFASMLIGNRCFVVSVKKGTDAEKKGVRPGDEIVAFDTFTPNRDNFWVINYLIYGLDPQENLKLKVRTPDGQNKELVLQSKFLSPKERKEERKKRKADEQSKPYKCQPVGDDLIACKLRTFEVDKNVIDSMMKEIGSRKKLILDLRGNAGGFVTTEMYLTGRFFEKDVLVGTEVGRDSSKPRTASGSGDKAYKGELVVLIDSEIGGQVFANAKEFIDMTPAEIEKLLDSKIHEVRAGGCSIMDKQARRKKTTPERRKELYDLYLRRHDRINNWDLVDVCSIHVIGGYLADKPRTILYKLAKSKNMWERRTSIVSTAYFIRQRDLDDTFKIAEMLLKDKEDLVHKATGWMLRFAGDKDRARLLSFLDKHAPTMPRVALRYAIEKFDKKQREHYLSLKKA